ncbi:MAG TPA: hypothetical protein VGE43_16840 [Acidimicrobiales bacterium]
MPSSSHPSLLVAAAASIAAGAIHAAAAGSHAELATLSMLFALTAVVQVGWGVAALLRPDPAVVGAGIGINLAGFGAWATTRTVGISSIEGLEAGQGVGFQDGLAALLAAIAVVTAGLSLTSVSVPRVARAAVPAVVAMLALATVPAMAQPHDHGSHDHDDAAVAAGEVASTGSDDVHDDGHGDTHDDGHEHDDSDHGGADSTPTPTEAARPTAAELGYPVGFVGFLDEAETPAARARAEELIVETTEAMAAFPDEAAVQAAGFTSIGDGATGWEHYINVGRIIDPRVLDPEDIESIVLKVNPDGTKQVASAMYLLPFGATMADAPDVAGELTPWHDHQDLCWDGATVVGRTDAAGNCARGEFRATQPMMHVWMIEHECGPFAGIEGSHGSGCADHGH